MYNFYLKQNTVKAQAYMLGFYTAKQDADEGLKDIPLRDMSRNYLNELSRRAAKDTENMYWRKSVNKSRSTR